MQAQAPSGQKSILLGRILGAFGVRGEVKLESFTEPARSSTPGDSRERMIPFLEPQYIRSVDFESGVVTVDWDPDF